MRRRWRGAKRSNANRRRPRKTRRASQQERETLAASIERLEERLAPLAREIEAARERRTAAQTALAQAREHLDSVFTRTARGRSGRRRARGAQSRTARAGARTCAREAERFEREERTARERAERSEIAAGGAAHRYAERGQRARAAATKTLLDARGRAEDAEREAALAQDELARALGGHRDQTADVTAAESRLHTIEELENSLEGHVPGTRAIVEAWQRGELRGIEGIVSNFITTDERYARAMDVAFGARLSNVVTRRRKMPSARSSFSIGKKPDARRFFRSTRSRNREGQAIDDRARGVPGVIGYAHTLVETATAYRGIVNFLVGNVLIVDHACRPASSWCAAAACAIPSSRWPASRSRAAAR